MSKTDLPVEKEASPGTFKRWPLDSLVIKSRRNPNVLKLFPVVKGENGKFGCDFTKPAKYIFVSAIIDLVEGKRKSVPVSLRPAKGAESDANTA